MEARGKMGRVVFPFSFARSSLVAGVRLSYRVAVHALIYILGNFSSDYEYEYEIRQAKRMLYAYAIPYTDAKKS
jgi:hypothetical protein